VHPQRCHSKSSPKQAIRVAELDSGRMQQETRKLRQNRLSFFRASSQNEKSLNSRLMQPWQNYRRPVGDKGFVLFDDVSRKAINLVR
jgi:hypothetical protein